MFSHTYYLSFYMLRLNLVLVQNFKTGSIFYFLLLCNHYHNLEQWQIKLKPVQKTLNQG